MTRLRLNEAFSTDDILSQIEELFDNGITLEDNIQGALLEITTTGSEQSIQHGLGRIPNGFIVLQKIVDENTNLNETFANKYDVRKDTDSAFLLFVPITLETATIWSTRLNQWTKEILYLQSNVTNLKVRLFVV